MKTKYLILSALAFLSMDVRSQIMCPQEYQVKFSRDDGPPEVTLNRNNLPSLQIHAVLSDNKITCNLTIPDELYSNRNYFDSDFTYYNPTSYRYEYGDTHHTPPLTDDDWMILNRKLEYRVRGAKVQHRKTGVQWIHPFSIIPYDSGWETAIDCNQMTGPLVNVNSGSWDQKRIRSIAHTAYFTRSGDNVEVNCEYRLPKRVSVDYARQWHRNNYDIVTNREETGLYRVYHIPRSEWRSICEDRCEHFLNNAISGGNHNVGQQYEQCYLDCYWIDTNMANRIIN